MPFQRPTLSDLISRIQSDFQDRLTGGGTLLRRAVVTVLSRVYAGCFHLVYGFLNWISLQVMPDTAESSFLRRWAAIWEVTPKPADFAGGGVIFTGTNGITVDAGVEWQSSDGSIYTLDNPITFSGGTATTTVTAAVAGVDGNLDPGTVLTILEPLAGVVNQATVDSGGIVDGVDAEDDPSLLARLLQRIQLPPNGGSDNDYVTWAESISGVTRAWCLPNYSGDGTVGVTFVLDGNAPGSIIPGGTKVTEVQTFIDSVRPVTANATVFAPIADVTPFTVHINPDTTALRAAVTAELADLLVRETEPGGTLLFSHIQQAVQNGVGDGDQSVTIPSANVVASAGHLQTMGTVTFI